MGPMRLLLLAVAALQAHRASAQGQWMLWGLTDDELYGPRDEAGRGWLALGSRLLDKFPGGGKCGAWHANYTHLHSLIRRGSRLWFEKTGGDAERGGAQSPPWRRFATYTCEPHEVKKCGGIGDMLLGISATFAVALVQNRALVIDHPLFNHAFEPAVINWKVTDDVPLTSVGEPIRVVGSKSTEGMEQQVQGRVVDVDLLHTVPKARLDKFFDPLHDATNLRIRWNRGVFTKLLLLDTEGGMTDPGEEDSWSKLLHDLGLRLPTAFACVLRYLFRPRLQVYRMAEEHLKQLDDAGVAPSSALCIHVRAPDEQTWNASGMHIADETGLFKWADDKVLSCAKRIEDFWFHVPPQKVQWVFLSNSKALKLAVKKAYKAKVAVTDVTPEHAALRRDAPGRIASFKQTVAEWLVLSRCSLFLMTESGFSKTAAVYSGHPFSVFMLARRYYASRSNAWEDVCDPTNPASFRLLGARWSGM